jgi:hypothetical protein
MEVRVEHGAEAEAADFVVINEDVRVDSSCRPRRRRGAGGRGAREAMPVAAGSFVLSTSPASRRGR